MRPFTAVLLLALCLALAACGDDDSGDSATAKGDDPKATKEKEEAKQEAIPGFSDVQECLEGLGYQLDSGEKNNIPVTGGDGSKAANLDVHPSEQAAQKFYAQLDVEGAQGGQFTVTYNMGGTNQTERDAIGECLKEAG